MIFELELAFIVAKKEYYKVKVLCKMIVCKPRCTSSESVTHLKIRVEFTVCVHLLR